MYTFRTDARELSAVIICVSLFATAIYCNSITPHTFLVLKCDFHSHSTYSAGEGQYTPTQLVDIYKNAGYDVLALTDHNTTTGFAEAQAEGQKVGLTVIRGEEIDPSWPDGSMKHIVALFMQSTVPQNLPTSEVKGYFDMIHAQGGLGIVAHAWLAWNNWKGYVNATYIDGWETGTAWQTVDSRSLMMWVYNTSDIYLFVHDFADHTQLGTITQNWTYVLAENNTEAGVREAVESKRIVLCEGNNYYGSSNTLSLFIQNQGLTMITAQTNLTPPAPPPKPSLFSEYFESGSTSAWSWTVGSPRVVNDVHYDGAYSCTFSGGTCYIAKSGLPYECASVYARINALPPTGDKGIIILRGEDSADNVIYDLYFYNNTGTLTIALSTLKPTRKTLYYNFAYAANTWYNMTVRFVRNTINGEYRFWVNGVEAGSRTGVDTASGIGQQDRIITGEVWSNYAVTAWIDSVYVY